MSHPLFPLDIVSAEASIFRGEVEWVTLPAEMGEMGVYARHAPLMTRLKPGMVRGMREGEELVFVVSGGFAEVTSQGVTVLADTVWRAADLDEARASEAKARAEAAMAGKRGEMEYAQAQAELLEAMAQLKAIERLRRLKG